MAQTLPTKLKLHRGDTVRVLRGKDRGKQATILAVLPVAGKVLVEGVNMVKKHVRPKRAGEKGQRVHVASPLAVASVQLVCSECKKGTRVKIQRLDDGSFERRCKHCQAVLPRKRS